MSNETIVKSVGLFRNTLPFTLLSLSSSFFGVGILLAFNKEWSVCEGGAGGGGAGPPSFFV